MKGNNADPGYLSCGTISGILKLRDSCPAADTDLFSGDNRSNKKTLDMGTTYYYASSASR